MWKMQSRPFEDKVGSGKYVESCTRSLMVMVVMKSNSVMERPLNYTMVQKENKVNRANQVPGTPGTSADDYVYQ